MKSITFLLKVVLLCCSDVDKTSFAVVPCSSVPGPALDGVVAVVLVYFVVTTVTGSTRVLLRG